MKNKGFSLIELIIVIAIMAILSGAIAPVLIRYINKTRLSLDIDTGKEIAKAIMAVVVQDSVRDNAEEHSEPWPVDDMDGSDFKAAVYEYLQVSQITGRSKKDAEGNEFTNSVFYYTLDIAKNKVRIYYGDVKDENQIYPKLGSKLAE